MMNVSSTPKQASRSAAMEIDSARRPLKLESSPSPAMRKFQPFVNDGLMPNSQASLTKMVNGREIQQLVQHRIRVPSFHNTASQGLADSDSVFGSSSDICATQTQATQPPLADESDTLCSPPRIPMQPQPEIWGRLEPIEEFGKAETTPKMLAGPSPFKIGRGSGSQLQINDLTVSSKHCSIILDETNGNACVIDNRSSNGTYVNFDKLEPDKKYYLSHGDCISLVAPGKKFTIVDGDKPEEGQAKKPRTVARSVGFAMMYYTVPSPSNYAEEANRKVPRVFGSKYAIIQELGKGNFAIVYQALSRETGENCAVKVIERNRSSLQMSAARFAQQVKEAEVLRKIDHPGIVQFRDLIQTSDSLFVITELLQGGELFDRLINRGIYIESRARMLMRRVVDAVAYLHERGIVHRDLKPENIVLKNSHDDTDVKLVDFGVATELIKGRGGSKTFCGSMTYVAPEVLRRRTSVLKQGTYGEAVDMWSIGVIVCVVLTLRPPFDEDSDVQMHSTLRHVLKFVGPEWDSVSDSAKSFITACFELKEDKRITAKQALSHEWLRV